MGIFSITVIFFSMLKRRNERKKKMVDFSFLLIFERPKMLDLSCLPSSQRLPTTHLLFLLLEWKFKHIRSMLQ